MTFEKLYLTIKDRQKNLPKNSYITSLFMQRGDRLIQKIGEEATEVVIASKNQNKERIVSEVADLWFHLLMLLVSKKVSLDEVLDELQKRSK